MGSTGYIYEYIRTFKYIYTHAVTIKSKEAGIWQVLEEGNGKRKCSN